MGGLFGFMHPKALAHHEEGLAYLASGNLTAARDAFLQALEHDARTEASRAALLRALWQLGDHAGVVQHGRILEAEALPSREVSYLVGAALCRTGRYADGRIRLEAALKLDPSFVPPLRELLQLARDQGDTAHELALLQQLMALAPEDAGARFAYAEALTRFGRGAEALAPLREALALDPTFTRGYLLMAELESRQGHGEEAWQILQNLAGRMPDVPRMREALVALCRRQAADAGGAQRLEEAARWWERLLALSPQDAQALARLERHYEATRRWNDLERLCAAQAARHPQEPLWRHKLLGALEAQGRAGEALQLGLALLGEHPQDGELRARVAGLARAAGDAALARVILGAQPEHLPRDRASQVQDALARGAMGLVEEAWDLLEPLAVDPEGRQAAHAFARAEALAAHAPRSIARWSERAWRMDPKDRAMHRRLVEACRRLGRHAQAARLLLALGSEEDEAGWRLRLEVFRDARLPEEAHVACVQLQKLLGESVELLVEQIACSLAARRAQRAWTEAEHLGRLTGGMEPAPAELARVAAQLAREHARAGEYGEAITWFRRHLSHAPASGLRTELAQAQVARGELEEARATLWVHLEHHPDDLTVALGLGEQFLADERAADAGQAFTHVLERAPDNLAARHGLAQSLTLGGADDEALGLFEACVQYEAEVLGPLLLQVQARQAAGDAAGAWIMLEPMLRTNPQVREVRERAAQALRALARPAPGELARPYWEALLRLGPDAEAERSIAALEGRTWGGPDRTPLEQAREALELGDPRRARELLGPPERLQDPHALLLVADALREDGDPTHARACYARAGELGEAWPARAGVAACDLVLGDVRGAYQALADLPPDAPAAAQEVAVQAARKLAAWSVGDEGVALYEAILAWSPDDPEAHFALAARLLEGGHEVEATGHLLAILAHDPLVLRAALMAARLLERGGLAGQAEAVLAPCVEAGATEAVVQAAGLARARGDRAGARTMLEHGLRVGGASAALHAELARMAGEEADGELAWHHWQAVLAAEPGSPLPASALVELAERLEPDATMPWLAEAHERLQDPELTLALARVLEATGRSAEGAEALQAALARAPYHLELALALGGCMERQGRTDRAREAYGIAAQAGSPRALLALGALARREGDAPQAASWLARALELMPEDQGLKLELSEVLFEGGRLTEARLMVSELLHAMPDHPRLLRLEQLLLREMGRAGGPEAMACWRALSEAEPTDLEAHRELARQAAQLGDRATQRAALERLLAHQGDDGPGQYALGELFRELGDRERARGFLEAAEALGYASARLGLAAIALDGDLPDEAARWIEAAEAAHLDLRDTGRLRVLLAQARQDAEAEWQALTHLASVTGEAGYREARLTLARVQLARGDHLARWVERGLTLGAQVGELPGEAVARLGLQYQSEGKFEEADRCLSWAAEANEPLALATFSRTARAVGQLEAAAGWLVRALEAAPGDPELVAELAEVLLEDEAHAQALELLRLRLREAPEDARAGALAARALTHLASHCGPDEELPLRHELTRVKPQDPEAWRALLAAARIRGRQELVAEAREHLVELDPTEVEGAEALGLKRLAEGHQSACALLERAASAGRPGAFLGAAEAWARFHDPTRAAHWLHAHLVQAAEDARTARIRYLIARALHDPEGAWRALADLERMLAGSEAPTLRMLRLALAVEQLDRDAPPATWLDRALELKPQDADLPAPALTALGHRHRLAEQPEAARAAYMAAAGRDEPQAMAALARLERGRGELVAALMWYERSRARLSEPGLVHEHARTLVEAGRWLEAVELLGPLVERDEVARRLAREVRQTLAERAAPAAAVGHLRAIAELAPTEAGPWRAIARHADDLGDVQLRIEAREQLLERLPDEALTVLELGRLYQEQGDARARDFFARAARLGRVEGHVHLLELALLNQDQEAAARHLEELGRAAPDDPVHYEAQRALARARGDAEGEWVALEALATALPGETWPRTAMEALARTHASGPAALVWLPRARALAPEDVGLIRRHGEALEDAGERLAALVAYREAYAGGERGGRVVEALLAEAERRGDFATAYQLAHLCWQERPSAAHAARTATHAREAARRTPLEAAGWERVLEVAPDDPAALRGLLLAEATRGAHAAAEAVAARLLAVVNADPDASAYLATRAWEAGELERAQELASQVLTRVADHPEARLVLVRVGLAQGSPRAALELQALRAQYPEHEGIALAWAEQLASSQPQEAYELASRLAGPVARELAAGVACALARVADDPVPWWTRALAGDPPPAEALEGLARHLLAAGRPEEALPHLYGLIRQRESREHMHLLALALMQARRMPEAVAMLSSLARELDHMPAWALLGELHLEAGELREAREAADRLLAGGAPGAAVLAARVARIQARALDPREAPEASRLAWLEVLRRDPADGEAMFGIARALVAAGELQEAVARLTGLLAEKPDWLDARALLAECHAGLGDAVRSETLYREVLEADPAHPMALMSLARAAQSRGEFVAAGDLCQQVLATEGHRETQRARLLAAYCARQLAEAARLRRDYEQAFMYADLVAAYQAPSFDLLRFQAELARDAGRDALALARYRRLLRTFPGALDDALTFARTFADRRAARAILHTLAEEGLLGAAYAAASLESDEGDPGLAMVAWERALALAPSQPLILRRAADLCRREEAFDAACRYYARLAAAADYDPVILRTWGGTALNGDLYAEALEPFRRLAEDHGDLEAALTLARCHMELGADADAYHWCVRLREAAPEAEHPEAHELAEGAAHRLAQGSEGPTAMTWWERYLELAPHDAAGWLALGALRLASGRPEPALEALDQAHELAPTDPEIGHQRAAVLRRLGRLPEARQALDEVLEDTPRHAASLYALAELAWDAGELQTVWDLGQRLLGINHKNPGAMELIGRCARVLAVEATTAGDWENAIVYWELLLSFSSDEAEALTELGAAYVQAGRFAEGVGIYRELARLVPERATRFRWAEVAAMGGFWDEAREVFTGLRDEDPGDLRCHQALAIVALGLGEASTAAQHYRDALELAPDDLGALYGLGRICVSEGHLAEAWEPLRRAAELSAGEADHEEYVALARSTAERLAEVAGSKQRWDEAIAFQQEAARLVSDPAARRELARAYYRAGKRSDAMRVLGELLAQDPDDHEAACQMARLLRDGGDLAGARQLYQGVLATRPTHHEAQLALAELGWDAGEFEVAWQHLQEAMAVVAGDELAMSLYRKLTLAFAEQCEAAGELGLAVRWWSLCLQQERQDLGLMRRIAEAQVTLGQVGAAAETYARLLDADPKDLEVAHILADLHRQRGDLRSAETPLLRIVALDPRHVPSLRTLMVLAQERGNPHEVMKRAYDLLDVEPHHLDALRMLAWSHEQLMERRAALEVARDIIALDPADADAFHLVARMARDLGDLDLAKQSAAKALYFQPRAPYYHTMGTIYLGLGQVEEAVASFGQALVLEPDFADAHAELGAHYLKEARPEKARTHLQRACVLLPPDSVRVVELQGMLDLIG